MTPMAYPVVSPIRRVRPAISEARSTEPSAAPSTTVAPGAPANVCEPSMSLATIVAIVTAAMCPVDPRATPAIRVFRARVRAAWSAAGCRAIGAAAVMA